HRVGDVSGTRQTTPYSQSALPRKVNRPLGGTGQSSDSYGRLSRNPSSYCLMPSTAMRSDTSSVTAGKKVFTSKSLLFTVAVASQPERNSPFGPGPLPIAWTFKVKGLVTPRSVKSPVTSYVLSSTFFTEVLLNVAVGNCAALKKSGLLMCLSRSGKFVSTLSVFISTLTVSFDGSFWSSVNVPLKVSNRP